MNPIAFEFMGLEISWYGIMFSMGLLATCFSALNEAKKHGVDEEVYTYFLVTVIISSLVGLRLYHVILNWDLYKGDIFTIFSLRQRGLALHGALITGTIGAIIYTRIKKISFWEMADIGAPYILIAQSAVRIGNFINKELYGYPTNLPWGIVIDGQKVHPLFLYEIILNIIIFVSLQKYRDKKVFQGEIFSLYLVSYSIGRFIIEGLKVHSRMIGSFRAAQVVSVLLIIGALMFIFIKKKRIKEGSI